MNNATQILLIGGFILLASVLFAFTVTENPNTFLRYLFLFSGVVADTIAFFMIDDMYQKRFQ